MPDIPRFRKAEVYVEVCRKQLKKEHGSGYLYINAETLEHLVGESHDSCARGFNIIFGPVQYHPRYVLGIKL